MWRPRKRVESWYIGATYIIQVTCQKLPISKNLPVKSTQLQLGFEFNSAQLKIALSQSFQTNQF